MFNRVAAVIGLEVPVGNICLMCASVWQDVIPGAVLRGFGTRNGFVPFVGPCELGVNADHDTPVVESFVFDHIANPEADTGRCF